MDFLGTFQWEEGEFPCGCEFLRIEVFWAKESFFGAEVFLEKEGIFGEGEEYFGEVRNIWGR